jgi:hypothetical protein
MIQEHQAEDDEDYESDSEHKHEEQKMSSSRQRKSSLPRASRGMAASSKKASEQDAPGFFRKLGDKLSAGLFKASKTNQTSLKK